jgi:DNA (cytosine-5)-methyltransferase 1
LRHIVIANGYELAEDLIPQFERVVGLAAPDWYLMENVQQAPLPDVVGYRRCTELLRDVWVGGHTSRLRRFSFGTHDGRAFHVDKLALHRTDPDRAVTCDAREVPTAIGGSGKRKTGLGGVLPRTGMTMAIQKMAALQGLPSDFLADAPLTASGKRLAIGNGVPLAMGRAVAKAVKRAVSATPERKAS